MDAIVKESSGESDWEEVFAGMPEATRRKVLDRAVRMLANPESNPNERETCLRQLQTAIGVDALLVFKVIAEIMGDTTAADEIEKWKAVAAQKQGDFDGVVEGVQSLRASLIRLDGIKDGDP